MTHHKQGEWLDRKNTVSQGCQGAKLSQIARELTKITIESTRQFAAHPGVCPMYRTSAVYGSFIRTRNGGKSWICYVTEKGTQHHLGTYSTESLAAEALSW